MNILFFWFGIFIVCASILFYFSFADARHRTDILTLKYQNNEGLSEFIFEYDTKQKEIEILKVNGVFSTLSKEEQEEKLKEIIKKKIASDIRKECIENLKKKANEIIYDVKDEYTNDPTSLSTHLEYIHSLIFENAKDTSQILFDLDNNVDRIRIIKVEGFFKELPVDEQEQLVRKTIAKFIVKGFMKFGDIDKFQDYLKNNSYELELDEYTVKYTVITKK